MNRAKIEDVLLAMGVPAGIKGFNYIADAIEIFDERGTNISITKELYPAIAEKNNTTPSRTERAIRHAFEVARSNKGDYGIVEKYIGFINCANFSSLAMLYKRIKDECDLNESSIKRENAEEESVQPEITILEIREVIRQELRMFLNELKAEMI